MTKCVLPAVCALALCMLPARAAAQIAPFDGRLIVSLNGAVQPGTQNLGGIQSFERFGEAATIATAQEVKSGGGLLDIGASYRITRQMGVGLAFTSLGTERGATIDGSLPHPVIFGQPRGFSLGVPSLEHKQRAVHLNAVYFMPFIENVDFAFSAGPTFFSVTQGFVRFDDFSEVGEPFTDVNITHSVATRKESGVGFNVGADATYAITPMIGAGALLRYTRGTVDFNLAEGRTASLKAGNVQFGVGLRLRF
ncbi:MAG: outer membrane beta-barrel protein [Acidobacteria bacterium]|nr:outer membrane beta-barrel protein [Acidobacteriota bacterium]